ncbi:MAG: citrate transporter [Lachnospiraceae bacterium]|nr:citrate transporter [Lachnospiraceae bacterium]
MIQRVIEFCKKEVVLVVATVLAVASAFVVPPSAEYWGYIDWHVLGVLLSLMIVMAGLQKNGLFDALGEALLSRTKKVWQLVVVLVMLCFFLSMAITNDVALITFVPFAVVALEKSQKQDLLIPVVVLQTIAANLGSMLTPIGNPQNLYLYNLSGMNIGEFILVMLPYTGISLALLLASILLLKGKKEAVIVSNKAESALDMKKILVYLMLFVLAFLVVLKVLPFEVVLGITLVVVFFMERKVLKDVDYCLLLTFISFFVFTGNMGNIPVIKNALQQLVEGREVLIGVLSSQAISNVPAALLLSGFTSDYKALLVGVNLGGLGTLIASMASLISYKILANKYNDKKGKYFLWFTLANIGFLVILMILNVLIK